MESERSSKNTTQPGSLRLMSLSYIELPPLLTGDTEDADLDGIKEKAGETPFAVRA
jgi:hypothetical protein